MLLNKIKFTVKSILFKLGTLFVVCCICGCGVKKPLYVPVAQIFSINYL